MLLSPQNRKQFRDPHPDRSEPVETRVARGADGDQAVGFINRTLAVMHMKDVATTAAPAREAVSHQNRFPVSVEAGFRMPASPVAPGTEPCDHRDCAAADAEQGFLLQPVHCRSAQEAFRNIGERLWRGAQEEIIRRKSAA